MEQVRIEVNPWFGEHVLWGTTSFAKTEHLVFIKYISSLSKKLLIRNNDVHETMLFDWKDPRQKWSLGVCSFWLVFASVSIFNFDISLMYTKVQHSYSRLDVLRIIDLDLLTPDDLIWGPGCHHTSYFFKHSFTLCSYCLLSTFLEIFCTTKGWYIYFPRFTIQLSYMETYHFCSGFY